MKERTVTSPTSSARIGSSKAVVVTLLVNSVKPAIMAVTAAATTHGGKSVKDTKLSPTATDKPDVWRQKRKQRNTILRRIGASNRRALGPKWKQNVHSIFKEFKESSKLTHETAHQK